MTMRAIITIALCCCTMWAADKHEKKPDGCYELPELYVKKESFAETLIATRQAYLKAKPSIPVAPKFGAWYSSEDYETEGLNTKCPPEDHPDSDAKDAEGKPIWKREESWSNGEELIPNQKEPLIYGLHVIDCAEPVAIAAEFSGRCEVALFLNGSEIARFIWKRNGPKHTWAKLDLKQGRNVLMVKVLKKSWRSLFHFVPEWQDPGDVILAKLKADFPKETAALTTDLACCDASLLDWFSADDQVAWTRKLAGSATTRLASALAVQADPLHEVHVEGLGNGHAGVGAYTQLARYAEQFALLQEIPFPMLARTAEAAKAQKIGDDYPAQLATLSSGVESLKKQTHAKLLAKQPVDLRTAADLHAQAQMIEQRARILRSELLALGYDGPPLLGNQWPLNKSRNSVVPAMGLPDAASDENQLWDTKLGSQQFTFPVADKGVVIVGADKSGFQDERLDKMGFGGSVLCLDQETGELKWEIGFDLPLIPGAGRDSRYGMCSSAVFDGDRVYMVTVRGVVVCLDIHGMANGNQGYQDEFAGSRFKKKYPGGSGAAAKELGPTFGDVIWFKDIVGEEKVRLHDAYAATILMHDDMLWVPTSHCEGRSNAIAYMCPGHETLRTGRRTNLVVLDKNTGETIAKDGLDIREVYHGQWSSPSMGIVNGKPQFYYGDGYGILHAFEAPVRKEGEVQTLKEIWQIDCNPPDYRVRDDYEILYEGPRGDTDGETHGPSEIIATPVFYKGRVYVAIGRDDRASRRGKDKGMLICIDPTMTGDVTGKAELWSHRIGRTMCTPAIVNDLLFIGDYNNMFYCFDATTGEKYWEHEIGFVLYSSAMAADNKVYIGTRKGYLWAFEASKTMRVLSREKAGICATPTAVDGMLFVPTNRSIKAFGRKK